LSLTLISLQSGDYVSAVENFESSGGEPYDSEMAYDLAIAYSATGDPSTAENLIRAAIAKSPHQPSYYDLLGDLLESTARLDEAESAFLTALELADEAFAEDRNGKNLAATRALIAAKAGECDRAVPEATTLRRHASETAELNNQLAQIFSICRQKAFALEAISAALAKGFPAPRIRIDKHFSWLTLDDDFQALVSDPESTPASE
jgi:tetratricopeptide (TPR) repeat protein